MYIFISYLQIFFLNIFKIILYLHLQLNKYKRLNYLAHAYLSFNDEEIQIGNLMGDFIKGNKFLNYPEKIKQGILLHRKIDSYTDSHNIIIEASRLFKPSFRLSGPVFVDILFDHFLANDIRYFSDTILQEFTNDVYSNLKKNEFHFDEKMNYLFNHMSLHNWLYNYKFHEGLQRSILGICKRYPILGEGPLAMNIIEKEYSNLNDLYHSFFPQLEMHLKEIEP